MVRLNDSRVTYFPVIEIEFTTVVIKDSRWLYVIRAALVSSAKRLKSVDFSIRARLSLVNFSTRFPVLRECTWWPKLVRESPWNSRERLTSIPIPSLSYPLPDPSPSYGSTPDSFLRQNDRTVGWVGEIYFMATWWDVPGDIVIFSPPFFFFYFFPTHFALIDRNALFLSSM